MKKMNLTSLGLSLAVLFAGGYSATSQTEIFTYTGAPELWEVPAGVTSINVMALGARGHNATAGGKGAEITGDLAVIPGEILEIRVGGMSVDTAGGYNGGGSGGSVNPDSLMYMGGGGGGASDVRRAPYSLTDRLIVAGGGGGMGGGTTNAAGGDAECPNGANGANGFGFGGGGADTLSGGDGMSPWGGGGSGTDGTLGDGGVGGSDPCFNKASGGGGGGGFYGGGGGASDCFATTATGGGGGGGSSLIPVGGTCTPGVGDGNGGIDITYTGPLGIQEHNSDFVVSLNENELTLRAPADFSFVIINMTGKIIHSGKGINQTIIPVSEFSRGMYLVKITAATEWNTKFVY